MSIRIDSPEGFKVAIPGGERVIPFPAELEIPETATDINYDSETLVVSWAVPAVDEGAEPTLGSYTFTPTQLPT